MLLWGESVDFTAPVCKLTCRNLAVDFKRYIVYHRAWLTAYLVTVLHEIFCTFRTVECCCLQKA